MSTRGCIARSQGDRQFTGVYHHFDSYPSGLGQTLWKLYHGHFKQDIETMLKTLIDEHPAGWSTIVNTDFNINPGYLNYVDYDKPPLQPLCYCHGERHETRQELSEHDTAESWCDYVYAFDVPNKTMIIYKVRLQNIANFDRYLPIATINLCGKKPDWEKLNH